MSAFVSQDQYDSHDRRVVAIRLFCLLLVLAVSLPSNVLGGPFALADEDIARSERLDIDPPVEELPFDQTQEEKDHSKALALFSEGYRLQKQGHGDLALRRYERAFRYSPSSSAPIEVLLPLAIDMQRMGEAGRYAVLAPRLDKQNPMTARRIAAYLESQGETAGAADVMRKTLESMARNETLRPNPSLDTYLRYEHARLLLDMGQADESAEAFAGVFSRLRSANEHGLNMTLLLLLLDGADGMYQRIGDAMLASGRLDEAESAYKLAAEESKQPIAFEPALARIMLQRNNTDAAIKHLRAYLQDESTSNGAIRQAVADIYAHDATLLARLVKDYPNHIALQAAAFEQYVNDDRDQDALGLLEQSSALRSQVTLTESLASLHLRRRDARQLLDALALELRLLGPTDLVEQMADEIAANEEMRDAIVAVDTDGLSTFASAIQALVLDEAGKLDEAHDIMLRTSAVDPTGLDGDAQLVFNQIMLAWAAHLIEKEQYARADAFLQDLQNRPALPSAMKPLVADLRATALAANGNTDAALTLATQAALLTPDPWLLARIGWIHVRAGRREKALRLYEQLIERYGAVHGQPSTRRAVCSARHAASSLLESLGQADQAVELLEQVLDEFPDDAMALNALGYLWADRNENLPRAHQMILRALEQDPENGAYRDSLGWVLYRQGRFDEAVSELERAIELEPAWEIHEHLGDAYRATNAESAADDNYRDAIKLLEEDNSRKEGERLSIRERLEQKLNATGEPAPETQ